MEFVIEGKGTVKIPEDDFLAEWYLSAKDDIRNEKREYVNAEWFYNKLKDNEEGIYQFCSQLDYETDSDEIKANIEKYEELYDKALGNAGMDTAVYLLEVFMQEATKEKNLHWW